jgi:hypothetical protein
VQPRHLLSNRSGSRPFAILLSLSLILSGFVGLSRPALASSDIQVSVFNMPNLNGAGTGCAVENDNLIKIIDAVPGYNVDGTIVDFVDQVGQTTLASQLAASRFFFMTDMETVTVNDSFLPDTAKAAFRNWTNSGGVMVMTGTSGTNDTTFLNNIYGWNLVNTGGASASEVTANTAGTPFSNATNGASLSPHSATDSISAGTVQNFTSMWRTSAGNSAVAVIRYGSGYVIYLGWDFYDSGPTCSKYTDPWVAQIVPAALRYASELSQSGLENATTSGGDLKYTFSQTGTTYYVVVPSGSAVPTNTQIKAMADYGSVTVSRSESSATSANVERVFAVTGLSAAADYTAYLVTEYDSSGTPTFSAQQAVSFSTKPGVPTVVSVTPDTSKVTVNLTPFGTETNFEYSTDGGSTWTARSPASVAGSWEITGLTNGTTYNFQFRSAFKTLKSDSTSATSATPAIQPAFLSNLVPSTGDLNPTFSSGTQSYELTVANSESSIRFTPTSTGNSITVAGRNTVSGAASSEISLSVGRTAVTIAVNRSLVGAPVTIYTIQVTRQSIVSSPPSGGTVTSPTPTPSATPSPRPVPRPVASPRPSQAPTPSVSPSPTTNAAPTPTPFPTPILTPVAIPELRPTPGVVFNRTNPISQALVDILSSPLAYENANAFSLSLPTMTPNQSVAIENGEPVAVQPVVNNNENGYLLQGSDWQVSLEARSTSGEPLALDESGNLVLNSDRLVQFQGTGFAPGSIIKVWLFSDPASLAYVTADENGSFTGSAQLPADIPDGEHTVQLNGLSAIGQIRSIALGVVVQPDLIAAPTFAPIDFAPLWNLALAAAGVVMMFLLVLVARKRWFLLAAKRRKRKEQREAIKSERAIAKKGKREAQRQQLLIDEVDPFLAQQVAQATPLQQFPVDSRRKLGKGAPPRKLKGSPFKRNRP